MIFCVLSIVALNISLAKHSVGQSIHDKRIELSLKGESLKEAISQLQKTSGFTIFFPSEKIVGVVSTGPKNLSGSVAEVLERLLTPTSLAYRQVGQNIVLYEHTPDAPGAGNATGPQTAAQEPLSLTGIVTDEQGVPLTGVSIAVKSPGATAPGRQYATMTNGYGNFAMVVPNNQFLLVFSYVGYESREITIGDTRNFDVQLKQVVSELEGVVVTGLYERPKETYTGASRSFGREELAKVSNNNLLSALSALDPSIQLPENINIGANPNALPEVVLRGGNSLIDLGQEGQGNPFNYSSGSNTPLFILDGFEVPLQRINDLDMNRIARVDILKDAAATAIYGSRAANGIIVIETIRPQGGKLRLTYTGNLEVETPDLRGYNLLDAHGKLEVELLAGVYENTFNATRDRLEIYESARRYAVEQGVNTNWLAKPLQAGIGQKHNIFLEGGAENALYGINLTHNERSGVMKASGRTTTTGNTYLSYRLKNFLFRNDLTLTFNKGENSPYGSFNQYVRLNPYWSPTNADGSMKLYLEEVINPQTGQRLTDFDTYDNLDWVDTRRLGRPVNPLYNASLNVVDQKGYWNIANNFFAQWQAQPWLRLTGRFSYLRQSDESDLFMPAQHTSFVAVETFRKGSYTKGYGLNTTMEGFLSADVNKTIDKHLFFGTLGLNMKQNRFNTEEFVVEGFPNSKMDQLVLGNRFKEDSKPTGTEGLSRLAALLANMSYAYDNRYLLDLSYRLDGSSQFGSRNRFAPFWSAGAGWNLHQEPLLKDNPAINRLRLRYSFGYTGSQNFSSFLGITTSRYYTDREYRGVVTPYLLGYGNPDLAWQRTQKNNFGADITLFDRLDVTANYFIERTEGSIATISTAPSTGFSQYSANLGDVLSRGVEVNARFNIINNTQNRNLWSVFVNAFHVSNRIERISNTLQAMNTRADTTSSSLPVLRYAEGQSTTAIWSVRSLGIDPSTGDEVFLTRDGVITNQYSPLNQVIVGDTRPTIEGTFGTNFELNNVGFNVYFRFSLGGQAYNQTLIDRVENVSVSHYNVDRRVLEERWNTPGDHSFFKRLEANVRYPTLNSSRFVQDNNFLNCESASVYYRFPDRLNERLRLNNTKITLFGSDLFRVSSIRRERGLDYPFSRGFTLQVQTSF